MLHTCAQQHVPKFHASEARSRRISIGKSNMLMFIWMLTS